MTIKVGKRFLAKTTDGEPVMITIQSMYANDCIKWDTLVVVDRIRLDHPEAGAVEYRLPLVTLTAQMTDWTELPVAKERPDSVILSWEARNSQTA